MDGGITILGFFTKRAVGSAPVTVFTFDAYDAGLHDSNLNVVRVIAHAVIAHNSAIIEQIQRKLMG